MMKQKLFDLFDRQKFFRNERLQTLIEQAVSPTAPHDDKMIEEDDLAQVSAAGTTSSYFPKPFFSKEGKDD